MARKRSKPKEQADRTNAENYYILDLRRVVSNTLQSQRHGVIPNLNAAGYGLFAQDEPNVDKNQAADKLPIWAMLTSDKPELWGIAVALIDEHEPEIKELAYSIAGSTQLHNIGFVYIDGASSKGVDVVYGMRRCLARACNHARSVGELPRSIKAELAQDVADPHDLPFRAIKENRGRTDESLIDEANRIQFLKRQGLSIPQIAERLVTNLQNIVNRLQLLRLTPEEQQRVHTGKLGFVNALKMLKKREKDQAPTDDAAKTKPDQYKRTPTIKQAEALYSCGEKPATMTNEEWTLWTKPDVRRFIAFYLGVEFSTFEEMATTKGQTVGALHAEAAAQVDVRYHLDATP